MSPFFLLEVSVLGHLSLASLGLSYLRPNFNATHPLNSFFILLVFLGSFSFASIANALTVKQGGLTSSVSHPTISACVSASESSMSVTSGYSWTTGVSLSSTYNGYKYGISYKALTFERVECHDTNSLSCTQRQFTCTAYPSSEAVWPEPLLCPPFGDTVRIARVENGTFDENNNFLPANSESKAIEIGGSISAGGCGFARSTDPVFNRDTKTRAYSDNQLITWENYVSTGDALEPAEGQPQALIKENLSLTESDGSTDSTKDTTQTVVADPVVSSDPDGSTVTTEQTTKIDVKGDGTKITETESTTFVSETDGIIKNNIETKTTVEMPDGSKTVTTENRIEYTQTPITNYTIDNSTNRITITATDGSSASQSSTKTESFDSSGSKTGESTETAKGGDQDVADSAEETEDEKLGSKIKSDGTDSWWVSSYPDGMGTVLTSAKERVSQNGLVSGFFSSSGFPTSGQFPAFDFPTLNLNSGTVGSESIRLPDIVVSFLRTAFFILSLFAARKIMFGG